jgi:serine/threonine-protein kinase haspin
MEFGGIDLESYKLTSVAQIQSVLAQVLSSMGLAEERLLFEHRDLHLGNVLIRPTHRTDIRLGNYQTIQTEGILCCIIDCSLARFRDQNGNVEYRDLVDDDWLFSGDAKESGQYQVYRDMRDVVDDCWNQFHPKTNLLWISFMATELLNKSEKNTKKEQYTRLREFVSNLTTYKDCKEALKALLCKAME